MAVENFVSNYFFYLHSSTVLTFSIATGVETRILIFGLTMSRESSAFVAHLFLIILSTTTSCGGPFLPQPNNEGTDQTVWIHRLVCAFAVRMLNKVFLQQDQ